MSLEDVKSKKRVYTGEEKTSAGFHYFETRSTSEVSRILDIKRTTIRWWRDQGDEDFVRGYELAQRKCDDNLLKKMRKVTETGLDIFMERAEDPEQRKKIPLREVTFAAGLFHDKARVLDGKPTQIREDTERRIKEILEKIGTKKEENLFKDKAS